MRIIAGVPAAGKLFRRHHWLSHVRSVIQNERLHLSRLRCPLHTICCLPAPSVPTDQPTHRPATQSIEPPLPPHSKPASQPNAYSPTAQLTCQRKTSLRQGGYRMMAKWLGERRVRGGCVAALQRLCNSARAPEAKARHPELTSTRCTRVRGCAIIA